MNKLFAILMLALLPLLAVADVAIPRETTVADATAADSRAWPLVFLLVAGAALIILIAARRRRRALPPVQ